MGSTGMLPPEDVAGVRRLSTSERVRSCDSSLTPIIVPEFRLNSPLGSIQLSIRDGRIGSNRQSILALRNRYREQQIISAEPIGFSRGIRPIDRRRWISEFIDIHNEKLDAGPRSSV